MSIRANSSGSFSFTHASLVAVKLVQARVSTEIGHSFLSIGYTAGVAPYYGIAQHLTFAVDGHKTMHLV